MSIFPTINSINEFRDMVSHKEEIRENMIDGSTICFCYMISSENTFDSAWLRECRGITFDLASGQVNSRPLSKFFNVNERTSTLVENLDWQQVVRIMDKMDGSLTHPFYP